MTMGEMEKLSLPHKELQSRKMFPKRGKAKGARLGRGDDFMEHRGS